MLKIWFSDESFAEYVIDHVPSLDAAQQSGGLARGRLVESDAVRPRDFHRVPTHLKQILYLDAPDIVIEKDNVPFVSVEISEEAGTGHNAFQRFGRLAAAVERKVPALYVYPEAVWVSRASGGRWDRVNPSIFRTLEQVMRIYDIPALLFYYPTEYQTRSPQPPMGPGKGHRRDTDPQYPQHPDSSDSEMQALFETLELMVQRALVGGSSSPRLINERVVQDRRSWMQTEFVNKGGPTGVWSPETAVQVVPSSAVIRYIQDVLGTSYMPGGFFAERDETVIYAADSRTVRADPYTGAFAALDYLRCRVGESFEDRDKNLAMAWGRASFEDGQLDVSSTRGCSVTGYTDPVRRLYGDQRKVLLGTPYAQLRPTDIPRYFMQIRWGTAYTKEKVIRMLAYFADAILFEDGALWREG